MVKWFLAQLRRYRAGLNEVLTYERVLSYLHKSFVSVALETAISAKSTTISPAVPFCFTLYPRVLTG